MHLSEAHGAPETARSTRDRRVVLIGAGHAHLHVLKHASELTRLGAKVLLIEPGDFWYSGSAAGMLGGALAPDDLRIRVDVLAAHSGVERIAARATVVDPVRREVLLDGGQRLSYDLASFNVGSELDTGAMRIDAAEIWPAKPIPRLVALRRRLQRAFEQGRSVRAVVIGGGASGCEIAANVDALARRHRARVEITIITAGARILEEHSERAAARVSSALRARGVVVQTNKTVTTIGATEVRTDNGSRLSCDVAVIATGVKPAALLATLPDAYRAHGGLRVDSTLRCSADTRMFGAGDCIRFEPHPLRPVGVYAVRQAPVLLANLVASLAGTPLREFRPQRHTLLILNTGGGKGLACRGGFSWYGRSSAWLKSRIDHSFLAQYR